MKTSRSEFVESRGNIIHVRKWGDESSPPLFMFHGWVDMSATFQFVVDALQKAWLVIAPDWAGFGLTEGRTGASYFSEYLLDLHALLNHYSPGAPVKIVAHSMGANIVNLYAGSYPERVSDFINLEGLGPVSLSGNSHPHERIRNWINRVYKAPRRKTYRSVDAIAARLQAANPRLGVVQARFLAAEFSEPTAGNSFSLRVAETARVGTPIFPARELFMDCLQQITARYLFIVGADSFILKAFDIEPGELDARLSCVSGARKVCIANAGHNLHHDEPQKIAGEIENLLSR